MQGREPVEKLLLETIRHPLGDSALWQSLSLLAK
jgi:hypothetical protein